MKNFLANNIKYLRTTNNITQEGLANELGKKKSVIGVYENGKAEPGIEIILKLVQIFKVNIDDLISKDLGKTKTNNNDNNKSNNIGILNSEKAKKNKKESSSYHYGKEKFAEMTIQLQKTYEKMQEFRERFKLEIESNNSDLLQLYKISQEADNFMYRTNAISSFYTQYLSKFSLLKITSQISFNVKDYENYSYQDFKHAMNESLSEINNNEKLIISGNEHLKATLKFLKEFDSSGILEDYLIK